MSNTNTGGPAFPSPTDGMLDNEGMTLRDYFAAKAMQSEMTQGIHESDFLETACRAYKMADDMLKARQS